MGILPHKELSDRVGSDKDSIKDNLFWVDLKKEEQLKKILCEGSEYFNEIFLSSSSAYDSNYRSVEKSLAALILFASNNEHIKEEFNILKPLLPEVKRYYQSGINEARKIQEETGRTYRSIFEIEEFYNCILKSIFPLRESADSFAEISISGAIAGFKICDHLGLSPTNKKISESDMALYRAACSE
ncbi:MAG: hypothetical protein WC916_07570 [Candidatus Woesearchaeota archaeon]